MRKNSKKLPKLFHYGFAEKFFEQKRPECPFKQQYGIRHALTVLFPALDSQNSKTFDSLLFETSMDFTARLLEAFRCNFPGMK